VGKSKPKGEEAKPDKIQAAGVFGYAPDSKFHLPRLKTGRSKRKKEPT